MKPKFKSSRAALLASVALCATAALTPSVHAKERIHPDCSDSPQPKLCTAVLHELVEEFAAINTMLQAPDLNEFAAYYHERATHSVAGGNFLRGRQEIRDLLLRPLVASVRSAHIHYDQFRFEVINPNLVIAYGTVPSTIVRPDGQTVVQTLIQTVAWIRNGGNDRKRPFVMNSVHTAPVASH